MLVKDLTICGKITIDDNEVPFTVIIPYADYEEVRTVTQKRVKRHVKPEGDHLINDNGGFSSITDLLITVSSSNFQP